MPDAPLHAPVPDRLAAWQSAGQLAALVARAGLIRVTLAPGARWQASGEVLKGRMQQARTYPGSRPCAAWRLASWIVRGEGAHAQAWATLEGRDELGDLVHVKVTLAR